MDVNALEAARLYLEHGWRPLAVQFEGKRPVDEHGKLLDSWNTLRLTADNLERYFAQDRNVGVILGEPSEWLVDVDLDCPEALQLADHFLETTQTFGRKSRRRAHRLYVAYGCTTKQFRDEKQKMLVELRASGEDGEAFQTVFPGSVHESGEIIDWDGEEEHPAGADADDLRQRVCRLAAASLLVRHGATEADAIAIVEEKRAEAIDRLPLAISNKIREWLGIPRTRATHLRSVSQPNARVLERARKYVARMPAAISGSGGHMATWSVALVLVKGFELGEADAFDILSEYNTRCDPPWSEKDLRHKISDAQNAKADSGWLLERDADYRQHVTAPPGERTQPNESNAVQENGERPPIASEPPWEAPIPFDEFNLPSFPTHALPRWLRDFVQAEAEATQTPVDLAAMLALSVCAAGMSKKFVVEGAPGWIEPVNIYSVVALPPAARKTPVFNAAVEPIIGFERDEFERMKNQIAVAEHERRVKEKRLSQLEDKIVKTNNKHDADALSMEMRDLLERMEESKVPAAPRFIADDVTPEKLAVIMDQQNGRIAILSDEGGPFEMMTGRYSDKPNFEIYLKGHPGTDVRIDRKNGTAIHIRKPAITVGLAVQPDVLTGLASTPELRRRGMLARIFWSMPRSNIGERSIRPTPLPATVRAEYNGRVRALFQLTPNRDSNGEWVPVTLKFRPDAQARFDAFRQELEPKLSEFGELGYLQDWAGKLPGGILRILSILCINNTFSDPSIYMGDSDVTAALEIGSYLIAHAKAAFSCMGADEKTDAAKRVLGYIQRKGWSEFSKRDLHQVARGDSRFKDPDQLDEPLSILEKRYFIRRIDTDKQGKGRTPSPRYRTNTQNSQNTQKSEPT